MRKIRRRLAFISMMFTRWVYPPQMLVEDMDEMLDKLKKQYKKNAGRPKGSKNKRKLGRPKKHGK